MRKHISQPGKFCSRLSCAVATNVDYLWLSEGSLLAIIGFNKKQPQHDENNTVGLSNTPRAAHFWSFFFPNKRLTIAAL